MCNCSSKKYGDERVMRRNIAELFMHKTAHAVYRSSILLLSCRRYLLWMCTVLYIIFCPLSAYDVPLSLPQP